MYHLIIRKGISMSDTDVLKVGLDNVQALLKKIDDNQTKLFETQNQHSKELERLNGLIEKNTSTTHLELKAISAEIKTYYQKAKESVDKLEVRVDAFEKRCDIREDKTSEQITKIDTKVDIEVDKLEKADDKLESAIALNTEFRQNMTGFSWVRHGVPVLMLMIAIATLIYTFMQNTGTG